MIALKGQQHGSSHSKPSKSGTHVEKVHEEANVSRRQAHRGSKKKGTHLSKVAAAPPFAEQVPVPGGTHSEDVVSMPCKCTPVPSWEEAVMTVPLRSSFMRVLWCCESSFVSTRFNVENLE